MTLVKPETKFIEDLAEDSQAIRLVAGELTQDEMLLVKAMLRYVAGRVENIEILNTHDEKKSQLGCIK